MMSTGENKLGYIAIGDAVLDKISNHEDITRESLIQTLQKQEVEVSNDEQRMQFSLGRSLLSDNAMSPD